MNNKVDLIEYYKEQTKKTVNMLNAFGMYLSQLGYEESAEEFGYSPEAMNDPDNRQMSFFKRLTSDERLRELADMLNQEDKEDECHSFVKEFVDGFMEEMKCAECGYQCQEDEEPDADETDVSEGINILLSALGLDADDVEVYVMKPKAPKPE